jgi:hypothetical protein
MPCGRVIARTSVTNGPEAGISRYALLRLYDLRNPTCQPASPVPFRPTVNNRPDQKWTRDTGIMPRVGSDADGGSLVSITACD